MLACLHGNHYTCITSGWCYSRLSIMHQHYAEGHVQSHREHICRLLVLLVSSSESSETGKLNFAESDASLMSCLIEIVN